MFFVKTREKLSTPLVHIVGKHVKCIPDHGYIDELCNVYGVIDSVFEIDAVGGIVPNSCHVPYTELLEPPKVQCIIKLDYDVLGRRLWSYDLSDLVFI